MNSSPKDQIRALMQGARLDEAKKRCLALSKQQRNDAETWFLLGAICGQRAEYSSAIEYFRKSIALSDRHAITHYNLGLVYQQSGKPGEARKCFTKALEIEPGSAPIQLELANALFADGSLTEAIQLYEALLAGATPGHAVLVNLALAYQSAQQYGKAAGIYRKLIEAGGESAENLFLLGNAYRLACQYAEAEAAYRKALALRPGLGGILNNLGLTLMESGRIVEAETCFRQVLQTEPGQADASINLASCMQEQRRTTEAREVLESALGLHPDKPQLHWDYALVLLKLGEFDAGWKEYEWRNTGNSQPVQHAPLPVWQGEDLAGKGILVLAEQGIGDEIMFASRYAGLASRSGRVVINCEPRLLPLFSRSFPDAEFRPGRQDAPADTLGSLAGLHYYSLAGSLPRQLPHPQQSRGYLRADQECIYRWKQRYLEIGNKRNIGISWKGGHPSRAKRRSSSIHDWKTLFEIPGINIINLQYGDSAADREIVRKQYGCMIHHWDDSDPLTDMDGFAAQIAALDLVIATDNSTVHLAGSLGVDTWVLQPFNTDWRWQECTATSYWYPAVTQFHPPAPDAWPELIQQVVTLLQEKTGKPA